MRRPRLRWNDIPKQPHARAAWDVRPWRFAAVLAASCVACGVMVTDLTAQQALAGDIPRATRAAVAEPATGTAGSPASGSLAALPFAVGESLTYTVRMSKVGDVGRGTMWVEGPVDIRGSDTYLLRFEFAARVGPVKAEDRTASWLDPHRMAALRFSKRERHPLSRHDERIELFPDERRWEGADGEHGASSTDAPLDELSFMYYLRTLPLEVNTTYRVERHFDAARNPTVLRVVGREPVHTAEGTWRTLLVEMRVRDPRRYRGDGVIWLNVSDDACRLPVRIQSAMPVVGRAVLTLESYAGQARSCAARTAAR